MALYSILTNDISWLANRNALDSELNNGVKVIAFCDRETAEQLRKGREQFCELKLLQVYDVPNDIPVFNIVDGQNSNQYVSMLDLLHKHDNRFNAEQYIIEHASPYEDIIVEAGAGTGKTTVMIDRIMYLIHTLDHLSFEDIGMITFTNEATQSMKHKIQKTLLSRFKVTRSARYIKWLEDVSKLRIQTIHSFSKDMISEIGSGIGYGNTVGLRSYKYEKRQIIADVLNKFYTRSDKNVSKEIGINLHEMEEVILSFWDKLENIGFTDDEILSLDWGQAQDTNSTPMQSTMCKVFPEINMRYNQLKMDNDAIAVGDIVRELRKILEKSSEIIIRSNPLKYLFVDEFQDSDNAQINTIAAIQRETQLSLFAVGDVKQSIYRFRGAVETAFERLEKAIQKNGKPAPNVYTLTSNYRTSNKVLEELDPIFRKWETMQYLDYGESLKAHKKISGKVNMHPVIRNNEAIKNKTVEIIKDSLAECSKEAEKNGTKEEPYQHVTVLTRTNYQLQLVGQWCRDENIPCYIRKEGTLYSSEASVDLFSLIKAFVFPESNRHKFDFLTSAYYPGTIDIGHIETQSGDISIDKYLYSKLDEINWRKYQKLFRLYPAVSVIQKIIDELDPVNNFISIHKYELSEKGEWSEDDLCKQVEVEALQYKLDLEVILENIRNHFSGQMSSLYQIYSYLKINLLTNRSDDEPDILNYADPECVYGMTVHKAKGLEFDTIIIPFTNRPFRKEADTEIIVDESSVPYKAAWSYVEWKDKWKNQIASHLCNNYYAECLEKEFKDVDREEARLLYVAMTRCIRRLDCIIVGNEEHSWAHMLEV